MFYQGNPSSSNISNNTPNWGQDTSSQIHLNTFMPQLTYATNNLLCESRFNQIMNQARLIARMKELSAEDCFQSYQGKLQSASSSSVNTSSFSSNLAKDLMDKFRDKDITVSRIVEEDVDMDVVQSDIEVKEEIGVRENSNAVPHLAPGLPALLPAMFASSDSVQAHSNPIPTLSNNFLSHSNPALVQSIPLSTQPDPPMTQSTFMTQSTGLLPRPNLHMHHPSPLLLHASRILTPSPPMPTQSNSYFSAGPSTSNLTQNTSPIANDMLLKVLVTSSVKRKPRGQKRPIPDGEKNKRYYEKRKRNNMAAKKSRDQRKLKETVVSQRALQLESENNHLRQRLKILEEEHSALSERVKMKKGIMDMS